MSNEFTHAVSLVLHNQQDLYEIANDMADANIEAFGSDISYNRYTAIGNMARQLEVWFSDDNRNYCNSCLDPVTSELLRKALCRVDWLEIATEFIEDRAGDREPIAA